jgi:hypothetical protein
MGQKSGPEKEPAEQVIKQIRRVRVDPRAGRDRAGGGAMESRGHDRLKLEQIGKPIAFRF